MIEDESDESRLSNKSFFRQRLQPGHGKRFKIAKAFHGFHYTFFVSQTRVFDPSKR